MIPGYYFDRCWHSTTWAIVATLPWHTLKKAIKSQNGNIQNWKKEKPKTKSTKERQILWCDGFASWKQAIFQLHGINREVEETKMDQKHLTVQCWYSHLPFFWFWNVLKLSVPTSSFGAWMLYFKKCYKCKITVVTCLACKKGKKKKKVNSLVPASFLCSYWS